MKKKQAKRILRIVFIMASIASLYLRTMDFGKGLDITTTRYSSGTIK